MLRTLILTSTILTMIFSFSLGFWVIIKKPRPKVNVLWFLTMMAVTVWTVGYIFVLIALDEFNAATMVKVVYFGATLIPVLFFHFVACFLYLDNKFKWLLLLGYTVSMVILYLIFMTNFIISGVFYFENFNYTENVSFPGFYFYLAYFGFYSLGGLFLLINGFNNNGGIRRKQILYIIIATVVGFGGASTNLTDVIFGNYPYGQLVVWIFPVLITYGIFIDEIKLKIKF